jgi:hypothetical protein
MLKLLPPRAREIDMPLAGAVHTLPMGRAGSEEPEEDTRISFPGTPCFRWCGKGACRDEGCAQAKHSIVLDLTKVAAAVERARAERQSEAD